MEEEGKKEVKKEHKKTVKNDNSLETYLPMLGLLILGIALGAIAFGNNAVAMSQNCSAIGNGTETINLEALKIDVGSYLKRNFLDGYIDNATVRVDKITDEGSLYLIDTTILLNGEVVQEAPVYATKDGKKLIVGTVMNLSNDLPKASPTPTPAPVEVEKMERPHVEVFVMSYCPYGMQMQKAIAPVQALLNESADIELKFVGYTMHGETEIIENTRQYCVEKEYNSTIQWKYVKCFIDAGTGDAASASCMTNLSIDTEKINACVNATHTEMKIDPKSSETYPIYPIHKTDADKYGVRGSPTLIINGVEVPTGGAGMTARTPEALKTAICNAYVNAPDECNVTLDSSGSAVVGSCG